MAQLSYQGHQKSTHYVSTVDEKNEPYHRGSHRERIVVTDDGGSGGIYALRPGQRGDCLDKHSFTHLQVPLLHRRSAYCNQGMANFLGAGLTLHVPRSFTWACKVFQDTNPQQGVIHTRCSEFVSCRNCLEVCYCQNRRWAEGTIMGSPAWVVYLTGLYPPIRHFLSICLKTLSFYEIGKALSSSLWSKMK